MMRLLSASALLLALSAAVAAQGVSSGGAPAQGIPVQGTPADAAAGTAPQGSEAPAPAPAAPQALPAGLDISSQVDRSEITIGDRIVYEIKVVYPAEGRVELPSVLGNLGSFEVKDYQASEPKPAGNLKIQTWRFTLSTFTVGAYMIPPQAVAWLPPGAVLPAPGDTAPPAGPRPLVFHTQPIEIKVVRTSPETVQDIADIAPLAVIEDPPPWAAIGLGAALLAALAGLFFWLRRRKAAPAAAAKPQLPPYEEAMERLAGLNPGALIRQNRARELCFDLSEVLRRYVSRRYQVDALEATTTEFLALTPKLPVKAELRQWIGSFCEATDMVKFAGAPLLESDGAGLLDGLKDFLRQTRPREDEGGPEAGASGPRGAKAGGKAGSRAGSGAGAGAGPGSGGRKP